MVNFTMNSMMDSSSAAACAEAAFACAMRSFENIVRMIDISLLMSIFVVLAGLLLGSAELLAVVIIICVIGIIGLILARSFIPHRGRTVYP